MRESIDTQVAIRRSQILLASSRNQRPKVIAQNLDCATQTVRNAIHAYAHKGVDCLKQESPRPKTAQAQFDNASWHVSKQVKFTKYAHQMWARTSWVLTYRNCLEGVPCHPLGCTPLLLLCLTQTCWP